MDMLSILTTLNMPVLLALLATISFFNVTNNSASVTYVSHMLAHYRTQHNRISMSPLVIADKSHTTILDMSRHMLCGACDPLLEHSKQLSEL